MKVWELETAVKLKPGLPPGLVFPQLFSFSQTSTRVAWYNSLETRKAFSISVVNDSKKCPHQTVNNLVVVQEIREINSKSQLQSSRVGCIKLSDKPVN